MGKGDKKLFMTFFFSLKLIAAFPMTNYFLKQYECYYKNHAFTCAYGHLVGEPQGNYRNIVITRSGTLVVKKSEGILLDTGI